MSPLPLSSLMDVILSWLRSWSILFPLFPGPAPAITTSVPVSLRPPGRGQLRGREQGRLSSSSGKRSKRCATTSTGAGKPLRVFVVLVRKRSPDAAEPIAASVNEAQRNTAAASGCLYYFTYSPCYWVLIIGVHTPFACETEPLLMGGDLYGFIFIFHRPGTCAGTHSGSSVDADLTRERALKVCIHGCLHQEGTFAPRSPPRCPDSLPMQGPL